jgi:hypothetical protein
MKTQTLLLTFGGLLVVAGGGAAAWYLLRKPAAPMGPQVQVQLPASMPAVQPAPQPAPTPARAAPANNDPFAAIGNAINGGINLFNNLNNTFKWF